MKNIIRIAVTKKLNIAHIYFGLLLINIIISVYYAISNGSNVGLVDMISVIMPIILFFISYKLLKKNDKTTRIFDSIAIIFATSTISNVIFALLRYTGFSFSTSDKNYLLLFVLEILSVIVTGLILFRANNHKAQLGFYRYFIVLQLIFLVVEAFSMYYITSVTSMLAENSFLDIFDWLFVYVLAIFISNIFLKAKSSTVRFYDSIVIAVMTSFGCSISSGVFEYPFTLPINIAVTVIIFTLTLLATQNKENLAPFKA